MTQVKTMDHHVRSLADLPAKSEGKIVEIQGGYGLQEKLDVMGIRIGKKITVVSKQPFRGPLTIKVNSMQMTVGRGMAKKILVEVVS